MVTTQPFNETQRIEAFSDGVFAIAITLLILDIKVPRDLPPGMRLLDALAHQWPVYVAYVASFFTIGVMWINHHRLFNLIRRSDQMLLILNSLLLMGVTVVPFPTSLVAEYLRTSERQTAAMIYSGWFFAIAVVFNVLWRYATRNGRLLDESSDQRAVRDITKQYSYGPVYYAVAFVLAIFVPAASLFLNILLAVFFVIPPQLAAGWRKKK